MASADFTDVDRSQLRDRGKRLSGQKKNGNPLVLMLEAVCFAATWRAPGCGKIQYPRAHPQKRFVAGRSASAR